MTKFSKFKNNKASAALIVIVAIIIFGLVTGGIYWFIIKKTEQSKEEFILTTEKIGTICEGCSLHEYGMGAESFQVSPDKQHIAYAVFLPVEEEKLKIKLFVDKKEQGEYDNVADFVFSPDGQHFAYTAKEGEEWFIFLDGEKQIGYYHLPPSYGPEGFNEPVFSPDSKHLVYWIGEIEGKKYVVLDGKKSEEYEWIAELTFSPNSKHLAYWAEKGGERFIVLDGKRQKWSWTNALEIETDFVFSPDGQHFAYLGLEGEKNYFWVLDGERQRGGDYFNIGNFTFSPDSQHFAYRIREGGSEYVILDGKEEEKYKYIGTDSLVFGPDSQHLAYIATQDNKSFVVLDGKEQKQYEGGIYGITFSPDSQHLAYINRVYYPSDGGYVGKFVVLDKKEQKECGEIKNIFWDIFNRRGLTFSPDSQHLAYIAQDRDGNNFVVLDGKRQEQYGWMAKWNSRLIFSSNSKHFTYIAWQNGKEIAVLDNKEQKEYDKIYDISFTPNSQHLIYYARDARDIWRIVEKVE